MDTTALLARLATLHRDDPVHIGLLRIASLCRHLAGQVCFGLTLCSDCERAYRGERWPWGGERLSISHGLCGTCEDELYPVEIGEDAA
jgi:hypothetical protein